jgi:cytochrome c551/c552
MNIKLKPMIFYAMVVLAVAACSSGTDTSRQTTESQNTQPPAEAKVAGVEPPAEITELLNKHTCLTCHAAAERVVGPSYVDVAKRNYAAEEIVALIYKPNPGHWPDYPPMIGLPKVPKEDALKIANWIVSLK